MVRNLGTACSVCVVLALAAGLLSPALAQEKEPDKTAGTVDANPESVVLPPNRRSATAEEIARMVKDLGGESYQAREKATKGLEEVGQPAVKALTAAATDASPEVQSRVRTLLEKIEMNEALAATWVQLKVTDMPAPKAVEALSRQSRLKLELVPQQGPAREQLDQKKVTLDLERVTFWEALEKLCRAAGLSYTSRGTRTLQLQANVGSDNYAIPTAYSGPFRVRITNMNYFRNLNFTSASTAPQPPGTPAASGVGRQEQMNVTFDVVTEPHVSVLSLGTMQVSQALDEHGQSLVTEAPVNPNSTVYRAAYYTGPVATMQTMQMQTSLRPSTKPAGTMKIFKGTFNVEVISQRKPLVKVDDLMTARGKVFKGEGNSSLLITQLQENGPQNGNVRFVLTGLDKSMIDTAMPQPGYGINAEAFRPCFELTDAAGKPYTIGLSFNYNPDTRANQELVLEGSFYYNPTQDCGPPARFAFYSLKRIRSSVPFEFQEVPLP